MYMIYLALEPSCQHALTALVAITFFEKPHWCYGDGEAHCTSADYPTFSLPFFSRRTGLAVETGLILMLALQMVLKILYSGIHRLLANRNRHAAIKETLYTITLAISVLELLFAWALPSYTLRIAPYLRACMFGIDSSGVRFELELFASILPDFVPVFILVSFYVIFFAFFGILAFQNDTVEGSEDFCSFRRSLWSLLILLTTANFPDVMMPAYSNNRAAAIFFISFVVIGIFVLMNILLAIVCDSYLTSKANQRVLIEEKRKRNLSAAFKLMDKQDGVSQGYVTKEEVMEVSSSSGTSRRRRSWR
jgi:hypothetical protein